METCQGARETHRVTTTWTPVSVGNGTGEHMGAGR